MAKFKVGRPCKQGHGDLRYLDGKCAECVRARRRKSYAENPEKQREARRRYREKNREKVLAADREYRAKNKASKAEANKRWRLENREKALAYNKAWAAANVEKRHQANKEWREKNAERVRANMLKWRLENPERHRAHIVKRRTRKLAARGSHTAADIAEILRLQKGRCAYCRKNVRTRYNVDHITALARGGSNDRRNIQVLCPLCNQRKHDLDPIVFAQRQGRLI